ncbi:hypothetical protein JCM19238_5075 [Vibrio ponticus]|nr:hypothetical protein JCM19238_5075 [Vibrio ponticus]
MRSHQEDAKPERHSLRWGMRTNCFAPNKSKNRETEILLLGFFCQLLSSII